MKKQFLLVTVLGLLSIVGTSCLMTSKGVAPVTQKELGRAFPEEPQRVYGGDFTVQGFERGILVTRKDGTRESVLLREKNPHMPPFGTIGYVYNSQGGAKLFGEPIQGEHRIFGGVYCLHIFEKAVIFCGPGGPESVMFNSSFDR